MHSIHVRFESIDEVSIGQIFGAYGVYVLWRPSARVGPSYIGEGVLFKRLAEHVRWATPNARGVVAVLGIPSSAAERRALKRDGEIVEAILIDVARTTRRGATRNEQAGKDTGLRKLFRRHGIVRIHIDGRHPFRRPGSSASLLPRKQVMTLWMEKEEDSVYLDHPFRSR